MGKNQRHKKQLKSERAKVKLKQTKTKFLPKGQNVTNTTFKIKPIVLQEQLREKVADVPLSKRKLDIKDLLCRIKHYNENVRHKACEEMGEMVKLHTEEIINNHLSVIILSISTLMQDKERKVRRAAIKIVSALLEVVPDEKLTPFYNYFLVNLRCAMTNINKNIQEDSLMFLDSFLHYNSKIISKNPEKLLPDFFTLISKLRSESNLDRTLTVNLGSKMTSVTWRIKVLSRLHAVLKRILDENNNYTLQDVEMEVMFDANSKNTFPLYKTKLYENLLNPISNLSSSTESSAETLEKNIATVVPLLYETWVEVMPEKKSKTQEDTILTEEGAAILTCVMNTLYLLWKYVAKLNKIDFIKKVFLSAEGKKFLDHLVLHFPYKQPEQRNKKSKISNELKILETNTDTKCYRENLLICLIYSALNINVSQRTKNKQMDSVVDYISVLLKGRIVFDQQNIHLLLEFLQMSLLENYQSWRRSGIDLRQILDDTIEFYHNKNLNEKSRLKLFKLLADLVDSVFVQKSSSYALWLESLPRLLTEPKISDLQVNCLLNMSKRGSSIFLEELNRKIPAILENLDDLHVEIVNRNILNTEDNVRRCIAHIFFYLPKIGKIKSQVILGYIETHLGSKNTLYLQQMLELRKEFHK